MALSRPVNVQGTLLHHPNVSPRERDLLVKTQYRDLWLNSNDLFTYRVSSPVSKLALADYQLTQYF